MIRIPKAIEKLMPKTVPELTSKDMFKGDFDSPCGKRHCLKGWLYQVFGLCTEASWYAAQILRAEVKKEASALGIISYSDDYATKAQAARTFNRAMEAMGYTEYA